jgi:hypothetical protein
MAVNDQQAQRASARASITAKPCGWLDGASWDTRTSKREAAKRLKSSGKIVSRWNSGRPPGQALPGRRSAWNSERVRKDGRVWSRGSQTLGLKTPGKPAMRTPPMVVMCRPRSPRGGAEIVVGGFGFCIVVAEDPAEISALPARRGKHLVQRRGQVSVAGQDQRPGRAGGAGWGAKFRCGIAGEEDFRGVTQSQLVPNEPKQEPLGRRLGGRRSEYRAASRSGRCPRGR